MDVNEYGVVVACSVAAYVLTHRAIPASMPSLFARGIYGIDINKTTAEQRKAFGEVKRAGGNFDPEMRKLVVPESAGIAVGAVYMSIVLLPLLYLGCNLAKVNAALCTIAVMLLLGFVDDVLDLRWRQKIVLSTISTIPLLLSYDGVTSIVVPLQLRDLFGGVRVIDLGFFYLVYISAICIFCTNSINILAGINGVEVGQSLIIAIAAAVHNWLHLADPVVGAGHRMSLALLLPFIAVSTALWQYNKFPSKVFVGDSYTYFAGMTLAVASVSGGYTKTMMLFFLPQLINFTLSIPQLLRIIECPRHRVPKWNKEKNVLENSKNLTILNALLFFLGPMHERALTNVMLGFQVLCCVATFGIRYYLAGLVYEVVN